MGTNQRAQIVMTDEEITAFIDQSRNATVATIGPTGMPHLVAMWYGLIDGQIWFETKAKSQKAVNLRRDDRMTVLIEDGLTYDTLRGVSFEGRGVIVEDDPELVFQVGVSVWERYTAPYTDEMKPFVDAMMRKRIIVRLEPERVRSWDHKKLGLDPMPLSGTTAAYVHQGVTNVPAQP